MDKEVKAMNKYTKPELELVDFAAEAIAEVGNASNVDDGVGDNLDNV